MTNNVALIQGDLSSLVASAGRTRAAAPTVATGGGSYLSFGKDGFWSHGVKRTEVEHDSLWAIDPFSYARGFVCWTQHPARSGQKNTNLGSVMAGLGEPPVIMGDLPKHYSDEASGATWDWKVCMQVKMVCVSGEDVGTEVLYETSSYGGTQLLDAYLTEMVQQAGNGTPIAVVKLTSSHYMHASYGKIYNPDLEYVEWRKQDDTSETPSVEDGGEPPAPTRRRRPAS